MAPRTIALLHLAPEPGGIERNMHALDTAVRAAARQGAALVVTPELAVSGYGFRDRVGTDWIERDQAAMLRRISGVAREAGIFLVLGTPLAEGGSLFNGMAVFAPDGREIGRHRKINVLRVGAESWSMPGGRATMVPLEGWDGSASSSVPICTPNGWWRRRPLWVAICSSRRRPGRRVSMDPTANGSGRHRRWRGRFSSAIARGWMVSTSVARSRSPRSMAG